MPVIGLCDSQLLYAGGRSLLLGAAAVIFVTWAWLGTAGNHWVQGNTTLIFGVVTALIALLLFSRLALLYFALHSDSRSLLVNVAVVVRMPHHHISHHTSIDQNHKQIPK